MSFRRPPSAPPAFNEFTTVTTRTARPFCDRHYADDGRTRLAWNRAAPRRRCHAGMLPYGHGQSAGHKPPPPACGGVTEQRGDNGRPDQPQNPLDLYLVALLGA